MDSFLHYDSIVQWIRIGCYGQSDSGSSPLGVTEINIKIMEKIGWIKSIRKSKDITFVGATTGQKDYQVTLTSDTVIEGDLKVGASFLVIGKDSITPKGM